MIKKAWLATFGVLAIIVAISFLSPKQVLAGPCPSGSSDGCMAGYSCGSYATINVYNCTLSSYPDRTPYCKEEFAGTSQISCSGGGCSWSSSVPAGCTTWAPPCITDLQGRSGDCCNSCPACTPTSCSASCPTGCGYGGGTEWGTDNCGNACSISCGATGSCCSPNCDDSGNYCVGVGYTGNCGQGCTGTQPASCTNPATVCSGTPISPSNGCGSCASGTKCDTPGTPTLNSPVGGVEIAGTSTTLSWNNTGAGSPCGGLGYFTYTVDGSPATTTGTTAGWSGAAGNHTWNVRTTNYCGATGGTSANGTFCLESWTAARVSGWSGFSACGAGHTRTRTRTCTEDCSTGTLDCSNYFASNCPAGSTCTTSGGGLNWTQTETQTCYGQMTGTFFDASDLPSCAGMAGAPKISGGTISLTGPTSYGPYTTGADGVYTTVATVLSPDTYTLSVNPGGSYVLSPKFSCQGASLTLTGSAPGCLTQPCETAPTTTHDFGFWRVYGGWWQVVGGSVYGGGGLTSNIPGTMPAGSRYLILPTDGLAYYKSGSINLGTFPGITVSATGLNAQSGYSGDNQDYDYFVAKMASYNKIAWNGSGKPTYVGSGGYDIYTYTGNVNINWGPGANEKAIYLIDGNVTITGNITIPQTGGRFQAIIASGTITFNTSVTRADGWFVANSLSFPTGGSQNDSQFDGQGSFVGWNSVSLLRDQGLTNNSQPAEKFTMRPDFIINAPAPILESRYIFRQE